MKKVMQLLFSFSMLLIVLMVPGQVLVEGYVVQPGDSLEAIAKRFGTTVEVIVQDNDIVDPNLIVVGQILEISAGHAGEYEVAEETDGTSASPAASVPTNILVAADFNNCSGINDLGGRMGAAFNDPDVMFESYVEETGRGCVARLDYDIDAWSAFWLQIDGVDLTPYQTLNFDIRAEEPGPWELKVELKRGCVENVGCEEFSVFYIGGINDQWQQKSLPLREFGTTGYAPPLSSLAGIDELVFTFERNHSGSEGIVYLDNIRFEN